MTKEIKAEIKKAVRKELDKRANKQDHEVFFDKIQTILESGEGAEVYMTHNEAAEVASVLNAYIMGHIK